jgi:hypothetical protein
MHAVASTQWSCKPVQTKTKNTDDGERDNCMITQLTFSGRHDFFWVFRFSADIEN